MKIIKCIFRDFYHSITVNYNQYLSKRIISQYLKDVEEPKLHIGCNKNVLSGWLNTDLIQNKNVTYLDAGTSFPINNNTFKYVYSEHVFEHLDYLKALNFITESYRILKKGGIIRIATPDLDFLYSLYINNNELQIEYINWASMNFCAQAYDHYENNIAALKVFVISNFFKEWGHKIIHNYFSLSAILMKVGFIEINRMKPGESRFEVFDNIEKHGTIIPKKFNDMETMVIEARKPLT